MIKSTVIATCVSDMVLTTLKNAKASAIKITNMALACGSPSFLIISPYGPAHCLEIHPQLFFGRRVSQYFSGEVFKTTNRFSSCGDSISSFPIIISFQYFSKVCLFENPIKVTFPIAVISSQQKWGLKNEI